MQLSVITSVLLLCLSGFWVADGASGKEIPTKFKGQKIGSVFTENIKITEDVDRLVVTTPIEFHSFTGTVDAYLQGRGDFIDGCSKRLYWAGDTSIRGTGEILKLSSRVRYEQWICAKIFGKRLKTRLFRDTKTVHWNLYLDKEKLKIVARLKDIKNFSDSLERRLGLTFEKEIDIPVPEKCGKCQCDKAFDPRLERSNFDQSSGKVVLGMTVSFKIDVATAAKCFLD